MPTPLQLDALAREWTVDDLDQLEYRPGYRYEIVDGALVVTPSPGNDHEIVTEMVRGSLRLALPAGLLPVGPLDVVFGLRSVRMPDILVAEIATMRAKKRLGPADVRLVIEVVSPSSRLTDRVTKPAQYADAGIAHYWRVEPEPLSLTVYALDGQVYRQVGTWHAGETAVLEAPFPVEIDVARLLPDA